MVGFGNEGKKLSGKCIKHIGKKDRMTERINEK